MSIDRRLLGWGIFLVILGAIPLAVNQGWLARDALGRAWQLWPLILVGIGLGLVLGRTRVDFLGGLVVAATLGVIGGALVAGAFSLGSFGCGGSPASNAPALADRLGQFGGQATVTLRLDCGSLTIAPADAANWTLHATGDPDHPPEVIAGSDTLVVRSNGVSFIPFAGGAATSWTVGLPAGPALDLRADLNAADARVDLRGLTATSVHLVANAGGTRLWLDGATIVSLDADVNAGDLRISLPATLSGAIRANAATVHLCAATGSALRLTTTGSVESDNFASRGLVRTGRTWQTPGLAEGALVVDLRLDGNAVSFNLEDAGACR